MKRRVICIAATALCMAMTSMAYAKEIETTTEEDEAMEYFDKVTERYQVEADIQDIDISINAQIAYEIEYCNTCMYGNRCYIVL